MKRFLVSLLLPACALCAVAQTQVSLTASHAVAIAGSLVSFSATVTGTPTASTPTSTVPSGTVTFLDGTTPIGEATLATSLGLAAGDFFTTSLSAGSHSMTAHYSGDANFSAAASAPVAISIEAFSITPNATALTLTQGQAGNITWTVDDGAGVNTAVQFACNPPPNTFTTCTFNPGTVTGSGQTALTITTTAASAITAGKGGQGLGKGDLGIGKGDLGLFATSSGALASLLFVWSPFGAARRRRLGNRAELSALILAVLLCSIMALQGCGSSSSAPSITPTPPGTQSFEVITSATANQQTVGQDTWITVTVQPAS